MTVEIEYVPNRTETVEEIVDEPRDDETVLSTVEEEDANGVVHRYTKVEKEIVVTREQYRVYTAPARGSKSWFYIVEENDEGGWEVTTKQVDHGRANRTVNKKPESTEAVRDALADQYDIELVN